MPAYYAENVRTFLSTPSDLLEHQLIRTYESDRYKELMTAQITAWREQIDVLQTALSSGELAAHDVSEWGIALEFVVPRRMGRIDTVLLIQDAIVSIEFKTQVDTSAAADQIEDYSLDLLDFHKPSHGRVVYPVVLGVIAGPNKERTTNTFRQLRQTRFLRPFDLASFLSAVATEHADGTQIPIQIWNSGDYHPVPTIVEAAMGMFAEMEVEDIAKADCDPINLTATVSAIRELAAASMRAKSKTVCFVTGVPGAGKTLAGLKVVHDAELRNTVSADSVFLTGNLPLVEVLRAALADDVKRRKKQHLRVSSRDPKTTIDTVLGYKKTHTKSTNPPHEKIVVFDEAQRAWTAKKTEKYLEQTPEWKGYSEPELMMAILNRHEWALLVALIGGGQEIHEGEAGIGEWGRALATRFKDWKIAASSQAIEGTYGAGARLFDSGIPEPGRLAICPDLHLDTPTRQFRGKTIARWTEAVLEGDSKQCRDVLESNPQYPIVLTRSLHAAERWLTSMASGTERYGCIASSEAKRLRAEGLELPPARAKGVEHWFLKPKGDVRSSFQLEVAATEFQIQGLEIDWACVCWGGDFLRIDSKWQLKQFSGTTWKRVGQRLAREYVINTYRVLLTRARQGMVLFVPRGSDEDATRSIAEFDCTAEFLLSCGAKSLDSVTSQPR